MQEILDGPIAVEENELPPPDETEEEMKLREEDKTWLRDEIKLAMQEVLAEGIGPLVDQRIEKSWRHKSWPILRNIGVIALVVTVVLTLFIFAMTEHSAANTRLGAEKEFEGETKQHLANLDESIRRLEGLLKDVKGSVSGLRLSGLTAQPTTAKTVQQLSKIVESAKSADQKIDPNAIADSGRLLIQESATNPEAWRAAGLLVDYKSSLNAAAAPSIANQIEYKNVHADLGIEGSEPWVGRLGAIGSAQGDDRAQIRPLTQPDNVNDPKTGVAYFVVNGGLLDIDGLLLRNVIVVNSKVVYRGKPVRMTHVYFVNCTFEMQRAKNTFKFAESILSLEPSTTFSGE
jgi:hypothetical protein